MVRSPDGDPPLFDTTTGVLNGDKLAPFICIIGLRFILKKSVDNNLRIDYQIIYNIFLYYKDK